MDDEEIRAELAALRQRNDALEARNEALVARLDQLEDGAPELIGVPVSRRTLLSKAAVIAAGVVAGGIALAEPAAAYTVVALNNGEDNFGPTQTRFSLNAAHGSSIDGITTPFLSTGAPMIQIENTISAAPNSVGLNTRGNALGMYSIALNADGIALDGYCEGLQGIGGRLWSADRGLVVHGNNVGVQTEGVIPLRFSAGHGTVGVPATATNAGSFAMDSDSNLYFCVGTGGPGIFRKLAGPSSAGAFHLLPQTKRVFDSRPDQEPLGALNGGPKGNLGTGHSVAVDCKANASGVPADATGVAFNLTITGTVLTGFLTTWGSGTQPGTSSINWTSAGADIANGVTIACDAAAVIHVAAGGAGSTHFIIDVTGYYR